MLLRTINKTEDMRKIDDQIEQAINNKDYHTPLALYSEAYAELLYVTPYYKRDLTRAYQLTINMAVLHMHLISNLLLTDTRLMTPEDFLIVTNHFKAAEQHLEHAETWLQEINNAKLKTVFLHTQAEFLLRMGIFKHNYVNNMLLKFSSFYEITFLDRALHFLDQAIECFNMVNPIKEFLGLSDKKTFTLIEVDDYLAESESRLQEINNIHFLSYASSLFSPNDIMLHHGDLLSFSHMNAVLPAPAFPNKYKRKLTAEDEVSIQPQKIFKNSFFSSQTKTFDDPIESVGVEHVALPGRR